MSFIHPWPPQWFNTPKTPTRKIYKPLFSGYLRSLRKASLRDSSHKLAFSHENLRQIESNPGRRLSLDNALLLARTYNKDPLELLLKDGEMPPLLLYKLGWEWWSEFKEFLKNRLAKETHEATSQPE